MEGDEGRQGRSPHDRSLERSASESGLSPSGRPCEESTSNTSSNSTATPWVGMGEISSMLAGPSSAAGTGEILERILQQRTKPSNQEDLVPTAPERRGKPLGGSNTERGRQQNSSFWQSHGTLWLRDPTHNPSRVVIMLDTALAQSGGIPRVTILVSEADQYQRFAKRWDSKAVVEPYGIGSGCWRLLDVIYLPDENEDDEDEDDEDHDMHLDIDNMSQEELLAFGESIGNVSTGLSNEVIMARLKQRKYTCLETGPWLGEETCCICQEEYVEGDDVRKLDCEHEDPVACIRDLLAQKNSCPIGKKTALAPGESNPHQE